MCICSWKPYPKGIGEDMWLKGFKFQTVSDHCRYYRSIKLLIIKFSTLMRLGFYANLKCLSFSTG